MCGIETAEELQLARGTDFELELQLAWKNDFCTLNFPWPDTDAQASWRSSSKSILRASRTSNPNSIPRVRAWYASVYACWCDLEESVPVQVLRVGIVIEQLQNFRWQHVAELLQMLFHQCIAFSFQLKQSINSIY